jgi:hypothetical protein
MALKNTWQNLLSGRIIDSASARSVIASCGPHYVYVLCRSDGTPFYVGKGVKNRCFNHEAEAANTERLTHKLNVIRAMRRRQEAIGYCIESSFQSEVEAHARERYLIELFGRYDRKVGPLTNQTDGGEGASNPSEESRERRRQSLWGEAEDKERRAANRWFQALCNVRSVPVKPLGRSFKPERLYANRSSFAPSPRQAAALAASAIANSVMLRQGAKIPRRMKLDDVELAVENGVGRDILSSGLATLADATLGHEVFRLSGLGLKSIFEAIDETVLVAAGVLPPAN